MAMETPPCNWRILPWKPSIRLDFRVYVFQWLIIHDCPTQTNDLPGIRSATQGSNFLELIRNILSLQARWRHHLPKLPVSPFCCQCPINICQYPVNILSSSPPTAKTWPSLTPFSDLNLNEISPSYRNFFRHQGTLTGRGRDFRRTLPCKIRLTMMLDYTTPKGRITWMIAVSTGDKHR